MPSGPACSTLDRVFLCRDARGSSAAVLAGRNVPLRGDQRRQLHRPVRALLSGIPRVQRNCLRLYRGVRRAGQCAVQRRDRCAGGCRLLHAGTLFHRRRAADRFLGLHLLLPCAGPGGKRPADRFCCAICPPRRGSGIGCGKPCSNKKRRCACFGHSAAFLSCPAENGSGKRREGRREVTAKSALFSRHLIPAYRCKTGALLFESARFESEEKQIRNRRREELPRFSRPKAWGDKGRDRVLASCRPGGRTFCHRRRRRRRCRCRRCGGRRCRCRGRCRRRRSRCCRRWRRCCRRRGRHCRRRGSVLPASVSVSGLGWGGLCAEDRRQPDLPRGVGGCGKGELWLGRMGDAAGGKFPISQIHSPDLRGRSPRRRARRARPVCSALPSI